MKIKICGITTYEDAIVAIDNGANALGFVFYPKSKRYITPLKAKAIIEKLPPFVEKVGLFVNVDSTYINEITQETKITLAQIHFDPIHKHFYEDININYIKVIRAKKKSDIEDLPTNEYFLIDSFVDAYGGEGKRLNLSWFKNLDCSKFILAGGLSASNIGEVLEYGFYGVDVSSGVELKAGVKDEDKIKEFINKAKNDR